jgi:nucleotide-binding universal stress UspA family protein
MKTWEKAESLGHVRREAEIRTGSAIEEICGESARPDVDLIVMATHGRTGFRHALIGSVAEHVARYADCAVVVVPSKGRA